MSSHFFCQKKANKQQITQITQDMIFLTFIWRTITENSIYCTIVAVQNCQLWNNFFKKITKKKK